MDIILDANAYIQVLHNHGRGFLQTNQFAELLVYLRRTGSRLVIPELTYNEVVARYGERLTAVAKAARDAWSTLQQVGMQERLDFVEPDIKRELFALGGLLHHPAQGIQTVMHTDYSGVDVKEVARRGVGRVRPANDAGEELRDVILWLIVLRYAKQSKACVAFVSGDKTFQNPDGTLHPTLQRDVARAGVNIAFYRSVGDFVKGNALESAPLDAKDLAAYVSAEELRGIATEQLLGSRFWDGTIVGAEVSRCELAQARRYRVAEDSYYVEARYTGEGTIRLQRMQTFTLRSNPDISFFTPHVTRHLPNVSTNVAGPHEVLPPSNELLGASLKTTYDAFYGDALVPEAITERPYKCTFNLRLSLRVAGGTRQSLEVDEFVLLGELTPVSTS
jgi:predicted nucleic acid-binding protein